MLFPSDFISKNANQKTMRGNFYKLIQPGNENEFQDYVQSSQQKTSNRFKNQDNQYLPDSYRFCNDVNLNNYLLKNDQQN